MPEQITSNPKYLRILAWNANGLNKRIHEFREVLHRLKIDVALISESHLKPSIRANVPNYQQYRTDRLNGRNGGTAIYIKKSISHVEVPIPESFTIETTLIKVHSRSGDLYIAACYNSPLKDFVNQDFDHLFHLGNKIIAAGDFNAKNVCWNCVATNKNGRILMSLSDDLGFLINAPQSPTHLPRVQGHRPDILDIVLTKGISISDEVKVLHELSSDHLPILFSWGSGYEENLVLYRHQKTAWKDYTNSLKDFSFPEVNMNLEHKVNYLEEQIKLAYNQSTTTKIISKDALSYPQEVHNLIKDRRKAIKIHKITLAPQDKVIVNRLSQQLDTALSAIANSNWQLKLESLSPEDGTLWRLNKTICRRRGNLPILRTGAAVAISDREKSEMFADSLFTICNNDLPNDQQHNKIINDLQSNMTLPGSDIDIPSLDELKNIIKNTPKKKAPGLDNITNYMIYLLPNRALEGLLSITKDVLTSTIFPEKWKKAKIIMIPKPGKPRSNPENYRPISLLPTLGKIVERIILTRLDEQCEELNIIPQEQFGFRRTLGTELQLLRLTETIHQAYESKEVAIGAFLDIKRAFDTVWHQGLISKLYTLNINPNIVKIIASYLTNRSFVISIGQEISTPRALRAGVPQGSVISPYIYNLFTSDIPRPPNVSLFAYADDLAVVATARSERFAHRRVQVALDQIAKFLSDWKLTPHPEKSQSITFSSRRKLLNKSITLNNIIIPRANTVKYLGVLFDTRLTWSQHITETVKKGRQAIGMLYPLISKGSRMSKHNKILLYRQVVRPMLTYGSVVWGTAAHEHISKLQVIQNRFLKLALEAPYRTSTAQIHEESGIDYISVYIKKAAVKTINKAQKHENTLITSQLNYEPTLRYTRNRPKIVLIPPPIT